MTTSHTQAADRPSQVQIHNQPQVQTPQDGGRALVVFSGQTELVWLRVLRKGFRHCFVVIEVPAQHGTSWVLYNPLSNGTQMEHWPSGDERMLRAWLLGQGYTVVQTYVRPLGARLFGWRPYTCVEAVKRILRMHAPGVTTPWQLYKFLKITLDRKKSLT